MPAEPTTDTGSQASSDFTTGITGSCLCGSIKVTIKKNIFPKSGHLCHCSNCRKASGCIASNNLVIEKANVEIQDPEARLSTYEDGNTGSGLVTPRSFCSRCGSPVCAVPTDDDTQYVLPLGIFPRIPEPEFELFAAHRHEWEADLPGTKKYKFMTSSGEM